MSNKTIASIRAGDQRVITQTYQRYRQEYIRWMQKRYLCSDEDARDCYQEVFCRFLTSVQSGKLTELTYSIKTYLFGIGRNVFSEQRRKNTRLEREIDEDDLSAVYPDTSEKEEKETQYRQIETILQEIDANYRQLLVMVYYEKRSMDYIAKKLGYKNAASAKSQKHKCMEKVRKMLEINKKPS